MSVEARIEGYDWADADVRMSNEYVVGTVTGLAHAGGDKQSGADSLMRGYWLLVIEDRDADGVLGLKDQPWNAVWLWVEISGGGAPGTRDDSGPVSGHAVGWNGVPGNLLPGGTQLVLEIGKLYLMLVVACSAAGEYSADVNWSPGSEPTWEDLLGLTGDGMALLDIADYQALNFRVNRIDPPRNV